MITPGETSITVWRGMPDTWIGQACQDDAGEDPTNLTGCTATAAISPGAGEEPRISLTATIPDTEEYPAADGWFQIKIDGTDAALLVGTFYSCTVIIIDSLGVPHPVMKIAVHVKAPD